MMPMLAMKIFCRESYKANPATTQKGKPNRKRADQPKPQSAAASQWQKRERCDNPKNAPERLSDRQTKKARKNGNSKQDCKSNLSAVPMNYAAKLMINIAPSCVSFNTPLPCYSATLSFP